MLHIYLYFAGYARDERHDAGLVALAVHAQCRAAVYDVVGIESREFGQTQPAGVEYEHHEGVAAAPRIVVMQTLHDGLYDVRHLVVGHEARQAALIRRARTELPPKVARYAREMGVQPAAGEITRYGSEQTELIKEIRNFLMENLDKRFTIEELSKKYLLNTSTLKAVFKAAYGQPVASYVRERRMKLAAKLLRESGASVAEIARAVGYETQGKFTKAFKESAGETPAEYRRNQKGRSR